MSVRFFFTIVKSSFLCIFFFMPQSLYASDDNDHDHSPYKKNDGSLVGLISSLYGGDGIQLMAAPYGFNHAAHFMPESLERISSLIQVMEKVNVVASNTGSAMYFTLDEFSGDFIVSPVAQGGVFTEGAGTLGEGRISLGLSYDYIKFTYFDGKRLDSMVTDLRHLGHDKLGPEICIGGPPGACYKFERDVVRVTTKIDLSSHTFSLYGSYGITDNLELSVLFPFITTDINLNSRAEVVNHESKKYFSGTLHVFDLEGKNGDAPFSSVQGSFFGLGDVYLRAKYQMIDYNQFKLTALLDLRLPTGNDLNLQGIKRLGIKPMIIGAYNFPFLNGGLSVHGAIGYEVNSSSLGQNEIDYSIGTELYFKSGTSLLSLSVDIIGSAKVTHKNQIGNHNNDLAFSIKWKSSSNIYGYYGIKIALDKNGLRSAASHTFGLKIEF